MASKKEKLRRIKAENKANSTPLDKDEDKSTWDWESYWGGCPPPMMELDEKGDWRLEGGEMQAKQVIVMRTDLNMRKGKMIAQGAHASIAFLTNKMRPVYDLGKTEQPEVAKSIDLTEAEEAWVNGIFTKICVRADSEDELLVIHQKALDAGLTSHLITDRGLTEFDGIPTNTCVGIGPNWADEIDAATGDLKLL